MTKIKFLWLIILVNISATFAQKSSKTFTIHFDVDKSNLDNTAIAELNKLIFEIKNANYYEIAIAAHTDNDANALYNNELSRKRAISVEQYLTAHKTVKNQISTIWKGENKPLNNNENETNKAQNRRVEITLNTFNLNSIDDLKQIISENYEQKYIVNAKKNDTIMGSKGTTVFIPANSFVLANGNLPDGEVEVTLMEYKTNADAILNNLSTLSNGKILESGGMLNITASYQGEMLKIKDGKALKIEMPSNNIKTDMQVFNGVKAENGAIEWELKKEKFEVKKKNIANNKLSTIYFSKTEIQKLIDYDTSIVQIENESKILIPRLFLKPLIPREPKKAKTLKDSNYFNGVEKVLYSKKKRANIIAKKNIELEIIYLKRMDRYNRKMAQYNYALAIYLRDSLNYTPDKKKYDTWLMNERKNTELAIQYYEKKNFNCALTKYLNKCNNGDTVKYNIVNVLKYSNLSNKESQAKIKQLNTYLIQLTYWHNFYVAAGSSDIYLNRYDIKTRKYYSNKKKPFDFKTTNEQRLKTNAYALKTVNQNKHITEKIKEEKLKNILNKNTLNNSELTSIYNANITQLGFINCDRFTQNELVSVDIKYNKNEQVYFSIKSMNTAYCPHNMVKNNYFTATMPKNIPVTMVVMRLEDGKPMFEKREIIFNEYAKIETNPKPSNTKEIMGELANL